MIKCVSSEKLFPIQIQQRVGKKAQTPKVQHVERQKLLEQFQKVIFLQNFKQFLTRKKVETRVYQVTET